MQLQGECVDLVYLDPPFFSNKNYEVIWDDEAEVRSFEDRWEGGIQVYLDWMEARLRHLHRVLKPTGSLRDQPFDNLEQWRQDFPTLV